jgi:hypothetical protein
MAHLASWYHPVISWHHRGAAFGWVSWFVGSSGYATALLGAAFECRYRWFCLVGLSSPLGAYYYNSKIPSSHHLVDLLMMMPGPLVSALGAAPAAIHINYKQ